MSYIKGRFVYLVGFIDPSVSRSSISAMPSHSKTQAIVETGVCRHVSKDSLIIKSDSRRGVNFYHDFSETKGFLEASSLSSDIVYQDGSYQKEFICAEAWFRWAMSLKVDINHINTGKASLIEALAGVGASVIRHPEPRIIGVDTYTKKSA